MEVIEPRDEIGGRILLTPGPLTTTKSVKEVMLKDIGSWDADLVGLVRDIRQGLLEVAGLGEDYSYNALHQEELVEIADLPETRCFRKIPGG